MAEHEALHLLLSKAGDNEIRELVGLADAFAGLIEGAVPLLEDGEHPEIGRALRYLGAKLSAAVEALDAWHDQACGMSAVAPVD